MAFGLSYPFGFSLFDGIDLFTEPRYIRRSYIHPEPLWTRQRRFQNHAASNRKVSRYSPSLFDLLSFGDELFNTFADEDAMARLTLDPSPAKNIEDKQETKVKDETSTDLTSPSDSDSAGVLHKPKDSSIAESKKRFGDVAYEKTEEGSKYQVHLPGLSVDDVKLDLDTRQRALIVKAEKKTEEKHEDEHGTRTSIRHVSISRLLPLPTLPEAGDISADLVDGVLQISVKHKEIEAEEEVKHLTIGSPARAASPSISSPSLPTEKEPTAEKEHETEKEATAEKEPTAESSNNSATTAPTGTSPASSDTPTPAEVATEQQQ